MIVPRSRGAVVVLLGAFALVFQGCASAPPPPPSTELRAQFGRMAVVTTGVRASPWIKAPVGGTDQAASTGAREGATRMLALGVGGGKESAILGFALAPVGALAGAVIGVARARSKGEVKAAHSAITKALRDLDFESRLRKKFVEITRRDTGVAIEVHSKSGHGTNLSHLATEWQTVLELDASLDLEAAGRFDPDITPILIVRGSVIRTADNSVLYQRPWCAKGAITSYFDLAKNDAAALRKIVSQLEDAIAKDMARDLFIVRKVDATSTLRDCPLLVRQHVQPR